MTYIKWTLIILFWLTVGVFFHYTLPQTDVVRITDTYEKRVDFGENSLFWSQADAGNNQNTTNRDVFFIQTRQNDGEIMVYRNEDTGWGWPPYFKFDTANLQAEAADFASTADNPRWVAIRHYGWRNEFFTIHPNAISVREVEGPDVTIIPWLSIFIVVFFVLTVWAIYVRIKRFRENRIDPVLEDVGDTFEAAGDSLVSRRNSVSRWLDTWKSK